MITLENDFLTRQEFHAGIERVLHEIATDRETQTRRWEQQQRLWDVQTERWKEESERWKEQAIRWNQQDFRWAQQDQRWEELAADRKAQDERINQRFERLEGDLQQIKLSIGALGARWGLSAEKSFRSALAGILTESYGVTVLNVSFQDSEGKVFGRPDQVEMDIVVTNGVCMAIEIKSSVDKQAVYLFDRKVQVYSEREDRTVNRKIVISPMVDSRAFRVAKELGIEVFTRSDDEALFRRTEEAS